jgi:hypothetical protein
MKPGTCREALIMATNKRANTALLKVDSSQQGASSCGILSQGADSISQPRESEKTLVPSFTWDKNRMWEIKEKLVEATQKRPPTYTPSES